MTKPTLLSEMSDQEVLERNEAVAKFMGIYKADKDFVDVEDSYNRYGVKIGNYYLKIDDVVYKVYSLPIYERNWADLMEVVEKIKAYKGKDYWNIQVHIAQDYEEGWNCLLYCQRADESMRIRMFDCTPKVANRSMIESIWIAVSNFCLDHSQRN